MRVLCVYCRPLPESFLAALRQETFAGRFAFGPSLLAPRSMLWLSACQVPRSRPYANALDQLIKRIGTDSDSDVTVVRGVLHGAMALYLTRYLNVPPARIPGEGGEQLDDLPTDPEAIRAALLDAFDRQRQVDQAARLVARHFNLGHSAERLMATLALAVLREDAGFHAYQMLEAGVRQFAVWGDTDEGRHILIAVARYLAAHSPTERATLQTADIARRLMRGGELHQAAAMS